MMVDVKEGPEHRKRSRNPFLLMLKKETFKVTTLEKLMKKRKLKKNELFVGPWLH
jgi:hypothetical protein